jgi:hypothetical protein
MVEGKVDSSDDANRIGKLGGGSESGYCTSMGYATVLDQLSVVYGAAREGDTSMQSS